ncbi:MAG: 3-deoxy-D-manno-octulosonic acid transferase [Sphingobacteriales bacterium]|nr:3-deoxy-D-manno-octulosonic acid transferase [Sphingobacteriales bacterium]MBI3719635.1 3-deoxy-D-manno-octulosonic acid transferase [Sphingobacteriales bacterium]
MIFLYDIFLALYRIGVKVLALWNPKPRKWVEGRKGLFERMKLEVGNNLTDDSSQMTVGDAPSTVNRQPSTIIWIHCASLGEFEQGRPIIEKLKSQNSKVKILLTFFSPSGYEVQKNYKGADWVYYLPLDSRDNAKQFLDIINPSLVIYVKYEFWFYYLDELKRRKIQTLLVSSIFLPKHPFFKWYGGLHRQMLGCFNHIFVQNEASKNLLATIGFTNNVSISGDTRFDRVIEIAESFQPIPIIESFIGDCKKVVVAGSTWPEDEEEMNHYANTYTDVKFIIAPHEIDEEHLLDIEKLFKYSVRFSQLTVDSGQMTERNSPSTVNRHLSSSPNVLIIDNIGMLSRLYKYGTITFVGGGFETDGVHNVLEAAVYGKPVIHGPVFENYAEAVELEAAGGSIVVDNALELEEELNDLFTDEKYYKECCAASKNYVYSKKGATERVMEYLAKNKIL